MFVAVQFEWCLDCCIKEGSKRRQCLHRPPCRSKIPRSHVTHSSGPNIDANSSMQEEQAKEGGPCEAETQGRVGDTARIGSDVEQGHDSTLQWLHQCPVPSRVSHFHPVLHSMAPFLYFSFSCYRSECFIPLQRTYILNKDTSTTQTAAALLHYPLSLTMQVSSRFGFTVTSE